MRTLFIGMACLAGSTAMAQQALPAVYHGLGQDEQGIYITVNGDRWYEREIERQYHLTDAMGAPEGTENGIALTFGSQLAGGSIYVGLIPYGDSKYPHPVYRRSYSLDSLGQTEINVKQFGGRYDMVDWEANGYGTIGYRLVDDNGQVVYDGKVNFTGTGPFVVAPTIVSGPLLGQVGPTSALIAVEVSEEAAVQLKVTGPFEETYSYAQTGTYVEFELTGLSASMAYDYTVTVGEHSETYSFTTAAKPGNRLPFTFAYASDSRSGQGGGERDIWGANSYIMKKIMALAKQQQVEFFQFSGDLINGYLTDPNEMDLQYANWKRAVEPWWHSMPLYISMGNHEALMRVFTPEEGRGQILLDRWPFDTESGEEVFKRHVINPKNGPASEDGASYDPNPDAVDFPSYEESVFYYTHDNVAVIVMNSDYFYAPSLSGYAESGGGLHAYIMDQQLAWVERTVAELEENEAIDHVFVTQHTPFFPNGGHVGDDMWYRGNNNFRTWVGNQPLEKGIIERRDQLLDILVNESTKVRAILTGDEHNYAKTELGPDTEIYPEEYAPEKITLSRTIWQINNGAAGAPYYAQEPTPWTPWVSGFTTQHALVLFDVAGKSLKMRVLNPDTLEPVDELTLVTP